MHLAILQTHNVLRWAILILGVVALVKAAQGLGGDRPYAAARRVGLYFTGALHLQLLLGLSLFFVSPFVRAAMGNMQATMADSAVRFFIAEHPTLMVVATLLMTIGGIVAKNAATDAARHRKALIFVAITLALILAGIPWQRAFL
ncbi:MAG: hypothetical protein WD771_07090 [Gemmatimonadaceae bacterium]